MAEERIAGRYRLVEPLGRGAMSSVWEAEDEELARRVAVKMLGPAADPKRFVREARAAAALSHPNIAALYDYGDADGRPFMVLELLPGGSLEDRLLADGPPTDEETARVAADVAAGLAHAHARGVVHRDLKPANILFDGEGRAKIADFGIAWMGGGGTLTEAGTVLGTASYISPEQGAGQAATPASDVYSFGVILFRLLTGRLPFVSANAMEVVRMHREQPAPAVRAVRAGAPAGLAALADAALAKDPAARPPDGAALVSGLRGGDTAVTQIVPPPPRSPRRRPRPLPLAAGLAVLLAAGVALAVAVTRGDEHRSPTTASTPSLSLPTVRTTPTTAPTTTVPATTVPTTTARATTTAPATTVPTTTAQTSTARATTAQTTTAPATTTQPATTVPTTSTAPATTAQTTTAPATTTQPATTAPTTTGP